MHFLTGTRQKVTIVRISTPERPFGASWRRAARRERSGFGRAAGPRRRLGVGLRAGRLVPQERVPRQRVELPRVEGQRRLAELVAERGEVDRAADGPAASR